MRSPFRSKDRAPTNRADNARQRRSQHSQERVSSANQRIVNPVRSRPVTSRGNLFGSPIHQQAGSRRTRRAFYLTMDSRGAEMRLPALPMINPGWRLASGLLAIAAIVGIISFYNSSFFQIPYVEYIGLERVPTTEINAVVNLDYRSIVEVDPQAVVTVIADKFPELVDIKITVELPNIVNISAVERQPVLAWRQDENVTWVDADGYTFPARGEVSGLVTISSESAFPQEPLPIEELVAQAQTRESAEEDGVPVPTEPAAPGKDTPTGRPAIRASLILLSAAQELSQLLPSETTLVYDETNGLGWTAPEGWQVYIGKDLNQFEAKYALYQEIAGYLAEKGVQPSLVSVEHLNAPFYRLEQ